MPRQMKQREQKAHRADDGRQREDAHSPRDCAHWVWTTEEEPCADTSARATEDGE